MEKLHQELAGPDRCVALVIACAWRAWKSTTRNWAGDENTRSAKQYGSAIVTNPTDVRKAVPLAAGGGVGNQRQGIMWLGLALRVLVVVGAIVTCWFRAPLQKRELAAWGRLIPSVRPRLKRY